MDEKITVKFLELVPGNRGEDCPANGVQTAPPDRNGPKTNCTAKP